MEIEENCFVNLCHVLNNSYMANNISFTITLPDDGANAFFEAFAPYLVKELAPIVRQLQPSPLPAPAPDAEDLITFEETMELLRVSRPTLTKRVAEGKIKSHLMGRRRYFFRSEVLAAFDQPLKMRA